MRSRFAEEELSSNISERRDIPMQLRKGKSYSAEDVMKWLQEVRKRKDEHGRPLIKKAQVAVLRKVCTRICDELAQTAAKEEFSEPLMWCMRGGPGVGK